MENDNNSGDIESGSNAGNMEGSVVGNSGGGGVDLGNIEANMSASNGGGFTEAAQSGPTLDLDPNVIGQPIAVMDSRLEPAAPAFIANVTGADAKAVGMTVMLGTAATAAALTTGPSAAPLIGATVITATSSLEALVHATVDAQQSMGVPGAFSAAAQPAVATSTSPGWTAEQSVTWYTQWTPDSGSGGNG